MTVGIIGLGVIGSAVRKLFPEAFLHDPPKYYDNPRAFDRDYVFICVPTPWDGKKLDCSIVGQCVEKASENSVIIICSTLQPGMAGFLHAKWHKRIVVQPEYFGETVAHPLTDLSKQLFLILGGDKEDVDAVIRLYQTVYNANIRIRHVRRVEAEIIKVFENRAAAFKVAQCQELYDACRKINADYETIRQAVYGDDPRFNLWWTFVYENARGFNSKCIPKDVYAWSAWAKEVGADTSVTDAVLARNEELIHRAVPIYGGDDQI